MPLTLTKPLGIGVLNNRHKATGERFEQAIDTMTTRNLDWVRPHADLSSISDDDALLLADAQTSGGLLLAGELPGQPIIGELLLQSEHTIVIG